MSDTAIEWTNKVWNPVVGCSIVSPGCTNCYAMRMASRIEAITKSDRVTGAPHYDGTTRRVNGLPVWTGKVQLAPERILTQPLRWRKPRKIFVNSMGDLFHEAVPDAWIDRVFAVMALAPRHVFQVLTKRPERMRDYIEDSDTMFRLCCAAEKIDPGALDDPARWSVYSRDDDRGAEGTTAQWPLSNVWLGTSIEDQATADARIPPLLATPAAVRFLSAEPLLGPVDVRAYLHRVDGLAVDPFCDDCGERHGGACDGLDWVIVGGESGRRARPMHPDWARSLRDQCQAAGVAFFFKQWGTWFPGVIEPNDGDDCTYGRYLAYPDIEHDPEADRWNGYWRGCYVGTEGMLRIGKARAGRLLDGREWSEMPS